MLTLFYLTWILLLRCKSFNFKMLLCSVWPIYDGNKKNEVDFGLGNKHVVDLLNSSCLCIKWDLSGIPCKHALSCMQLLAISLETYVNTCYTVTTQLNFYNHLINLIKGNSLKTLNHYEILLICKMCLTYLNFYV